MEDKKPTRLIKPPQRKGRHAWIYTCDNGQGYTLRQLAGVFDISGNCIVCRIRKHGWDYPQLFAPRARKGYAPAGSGNDAWKLSTKPRNGNLAKIQTMGVLERKYLQAERRASSTAV